jgi:hypothetical protein
MFACARAGRITHVGYPDVRPVKFLHRLVVRFVILDTPVVILHGLVWIPASVLRAVSTARPKKDMVAARTSGEDILTLRILRSMMAGSSHIDSTRQDMATSIARRGERNTHRGR